jgi:hypothetical protein
MLSKCDHIRARITDLKQRISATEETLDHMQAAQDALIALRQAWRAEVGALVDELVEGSDND